MPRGIARIISVITVVFLGNQNVQCVMDVVVPLSIVFFGVTGATQIMSRIVEIFEDEMNLPVRWKGIAYHTSQFNKDVRLRVVHDGMNGIQSQAVQVVFLKPVKRIVDEVISNRTAAYPIKIDRLAPWSFVALRKELRRVKRLVISFRAEVVVHNIKQHHHIFLMCGIYEVFQVFRPPVWRSRRIWQHAVVSPIAIARETRDWHDLDSRNSEIR